MESFGSNMRHTVATTQKQLLMGLAAGCLTLVCLLMWQFWGRAKLAGIVVALVPPLLIVLRYPKIAVGLLAFALSASLDTLIPYTLSISLILCLSMTVFLKLVDGDFWWTTPPFTYLTLLLFAWSVFTLIWVTSNDNIWYEHIVVSVLVILLVPQLVTTRDDFKSVVVAAGAGVILTAVSSAYGVYILFSKGLAVQAAGSVERLNDARYYGHWINPNALAHSIMPFTIMLLPYIRRNAKLLSRLLLIIALVGGTTAIAMSLSRAGILSFALAVAVVIAGSKNRLRLLTLAIITVGMILLVVPVNFWGRMTSFSKGRYDASINQREYVYETATEMSIDAFPFGLGLGNFYTRQQDYNVLSFKVPHAHNTALQALSETGIIGLALLLAAYASTVIGVWRFRSFLKSDSLTRQMRIAMIAIWIGISVGMLFEDLWWRPPDVLALTLMSIFPLLFSPRANDQTTLA